LHLKSLISYLQFTVRVLCCFIISGTIAWADDLRLRDGTIIKADAVWERDDVVWYRQGQIIRSIPVAEVLRGQERAQATEPAPTAPRRSPWKKATRRPQRQLAASPEIKLSPTPPPDPNAMPITRIIFKDGAQLDADAVWEMGDKVGYRLGNMQTFIDKTAIAQVLSDDTPITSSPITIVAPPFSFTTRHAGLDQLIAVNARRHNVDPLLIYLVMQQESGFNHRAVSRAGARGLMQLMPGTARQLGVRNIHDPVENVEAGTRYLKNLLQRFSGNMNLALAAYNAGEDAVARYGNRVPPYRETINYVRRISGTYHQLKK
jgi:hypothetical protein